MAIHESVKKQPILEEIEGKYRIGYIDSVDVEWANMYVTIGLVVVDSLENRKFVRKHT